MRSRSRYNCNREYKKWRHQRPRQQHKSVIWLGDLDWCCTCGTLFGAIFWRSVPNDVRFSYLRFWRQREPAAVNLSFLAFACIKTIRVACFCTSWPTWNNRKTLNRTQRCILMWRFHCSSCCSFFSIIPSHYAWEMYSICPGIKSISAVWR